MGVSRSQEQLIRAQDWIYESGGRDWRDGLLLGNGDLGVVASAPAHLEWVVNKVDVFDPTVDEDASAKRLCHAEFLRRIQGASPRNTLFLDEAERSCGGRPGIRGTLSPAVLRLRFWRGIGWAAPPVPRTRQHLSLFDGWLDEEMSAHGFHPQVRSIVPRGAALLCIRVTEPAASGRIHICELVRPANGLLPPPCWRRLEDGVAFEQRLPGGRGRYAVALRIRPRGGGGASQAGVQDACAAELTQSGDAELFLSVRSSLDGSDPLGAALAETGAAVRRGFDVLEEEGTAWWHRWWDNAHADFGGHRRIQKYFTFSLYALGCTFGKAPMPGLNGLAYGPLDERTPGVGYQGYTHDQNAQIPAMPLMPLNRVDLIVPLVDTYWRVRRTLRRETRRLFGCEGIFLPLTMNQLGREYPTGSYRYTLCGSAYTGMILARAWRFSRDRRLLKERLYPLLREFVLFYVSLMRRGEDGAYHLDWSVPPEIFTLTRDENATVSLLRVCLETAVEAAGILRRDRRRLPLWKDILAHYPPVPRTPEGALWCGPDVPPEHYFYGGHLWYPFFPAGILDDPETAERTLRLVAGQAAERSFADRPGQWHLNHAWSMFNTASALVRLGRERHPEAWDWLLRFLDLFAKENGLFSHDPILIGDPRRSEENQRRNQARLDTGRTFCDGAPLAPDNPEVPRPPCVTDNPDAKRLAPAVLEGGSEFLHLAAETLLQSHGGVVRLFPAVPRDFTGSFRGFLAEGGFRVSAEMRGGRLVHARITATAPGDCQVTTPDGRIHRRRLAPGESLELDGAGEERDLT